MLNIPTIDFKDYNEADPGTVAALADKVASALGTAGFMSIRNLGISQEQVSQAFKAAEWFFLQDLSKKQRASYATAGENFGFQEVGIEHLDPTQPADIKETFTMRNVLNHDPDDSRWPSDEFRKTVTLFYKACIEVAYRIQRVCASALSVDQEFFVDYHQGENVTLRLLYYPADQDGPVESGQLGAGAHTDYGMLTLLFQNGIGGLQVQDGSGVWHDVDPDPETILINTGDLMERWTNGRFRSTCHRVQPKVGAQGRFSIAMFVDPDSATPVTVLRSCLADDEVPRFPEITAGEYIQERIEASHRSGVPLS